AQQGWQVLALPHAQRNAPLFLRTAGNELSLSHVIPSAPRDLLRTETPCPGDSSLRRDDRLNRRSDDLEVAVQFPMADVLAELALFPFAAGGIVVDEGIAEQ